MRHKIPRQRSWETQSTAAFPTSSETSGVLGVPPPPLPKLSLASQEQLGWEQAWAGGSGSCVWWLQACVVAPSPCQHLPPPPGSPRCFSWSNVPNAVTVWKQTGHTPSPLGTGHVARRDMLVAGCLHHLEALLNHLTANFVALSSTEEEKTPIHSSRAVESYGRVSLYRIGFF